MDPGNIRVMNAHMGRKNIIPYKVMQKLMRSTASEIKNLLMKHCGPHGKFAMIVDDTRPDIPPKFTKDGIGIARSIEYHNPMQSIMRNEILSMGSSLEREVGDGTTSAMIIACVMFNELSKKDNLKKMGIYNNNITYDELKRIYNTFTNRFNKFLDNTSFKYDFLETLGMSKKEAIRTIAYWQALTSSHGNYDLSAEISQVFSEMPPEAWRNIAFQQEKYETDRLIWKTTDDAQFSMNAQPLIGTLLNRKAGTEYYQEVVEVIVLNTPLATDDVVSRRVIDYATKLASENETPIIIICPSGIDTVTTEALVKQTRPNFAVFCNRTSGQRYNDIIGLQSVAGQYPVYTTEKVGSFKARVHYQQGELRFENIYNVEDETKPTHPDVDNPGTPLYEMLNELDDIIEQMEKTAPESGYSQQELKRFRKLYNRVKYRYTYTIHIGGSARDSMSATDVVTDVLLSVKNSLMYGFMPAGNCAMSSMMEQHTNKPIPGTNWFKSDVVENLLRKAALKGTKAVDKAMNFTEYPFSVEPDEEDLIFEGLNVYTRGNNSFGLEIYTLVDYIHNGSLIITEKNSSWIPIQPVDVEKAIMKKFGDVFLKYLYSEKIVTAGGVYLEKENKLTGLLNKLRRRKTK